MKKVVLDEDSLSREHMKDAVLRSGYLLEGRVAAALRKAAYKATTNRAFVDLEGNKSREYDVFAYKCLTIYQGGSFEIYPTIICECKNNPRPIAFIVDEGAQFEPLIDEVMVSGMPAKIRRGAGFISVQEFLGARKLHHFCNPTTVVSPKCCTFELKKDKSAWMANHSDDLYETFRTLSKALEFEIDQDFENMGQWFDAKEKQHAFMDLSFYYPLVVYQGEIYAANINKDEHDVRLEKRDHIQFNPEFFSFYENDVISYHFDVISESYLGRYLALIEHEMDSFKEVFCGKKTTVVNSVKQIMQQCRAAERDSRSYKTYLRYEY